MKKDISFPKMQDVALALVPETVDDFWKAYLVNNTGEVLTNILISSKGYAKSEEGDRTATTRHHIPELPVKSYAVIEPVLPEVVALTNEYWVSFWMKGQLYDKKFIFLEGTVSEEFFAEVPLLEKKGMVHY